jgi:hypothetical protein
MRYDMTARQNIAVGRIDRAVPDASIERAARQSLAHDVIGRELGRIAVNDVLPPKT